MRIGEGVRCKGVEGSAGGDGEEGGRSGVVFVGGAEEGMVGEGRLAEGGGGVYVQTKAEDCGWAGANDARQEPYGKKGLLRFVVALCLFAMEADVWREAMDRQEMKSDLRWDLSDVRAFLGCSPITRDNIPTRGEPSFVLAQVTFLFVRWKRCGKRAKV